MLSSAPTTTSSSPLPPPSVTSDPRRVSMETYWREVHSIEEEKEGEEDEEEERKSMDEVELEEAWLTEAGLSSLVMGSSEEETLPPAEALLSTLTQQQVATVKRRLDNYNETLRKRNRQPIRDVRDIFTQPDDDSAHRCPSPSSHQADSAPSRYHTKTKTIRRNAHGVRPTLPMFLIEDQLPEHPPSATNTQRPPNTHSPTNTQRPPNTHSPTNTQCPSNTHSPTNTQRRPNTHSPTNTQCPPNTNSPSNTQCPPNTHSPTNTPSPPHLPPITRARRADWLLRDFPYSEGVTEHKQGGACWDCFHEDNSDMPFLPALPSQGFTCIDDLSSRDLTRLGFISHIELSTFLLALGIQTKRTRPPRHRTLDSGVFGVPLNSLLDNDRKTFPGIKVPIVFQKLVAVLEQTGLQTEGILRVPGSAARLKYLRRELDKCGGSFDWSAVRQVDAAGLLKLFIRELPTPLLTLTHWSTYRAVLGIQSVVHQVQALQLLSLLLPEANRDMLRALLVFLRNVVSQQDQNRMTLWNVSMVMAPNLFTCRHYGSKHSLARQRQEMEEAVGGAHLVRLMITNQDLLWTVPNFLLSQVRQVNQRQFGLMTTKIRLPRKKSDRNQVTDLCEGVIRVHAPLHTKVSMAIQLDGQIRARDITAHFECENSSPAPRLYEVGGNICERRLHPDCVLLDVYRVNPHCDWLIKP